MATAFCSEQEVLALPFAHVSIFFTVSLLHESTHTGQLKKESPVDLGHCHWGAVAKQSHIAVYMQFIVHMKIFVGAIFHDTWACHDNDKNCSAP